MGKEFLTFQRLEHMKYGEKCQNANIGRYISLGCQGANNMAFGKIETSIVGVHKHAYYRSSRHLVPKSIVHAYGRVCKMKKQHACSEGNII